MVEAAAKGASVILVGLDLRSMRCLLEGFFDLKHLRSSTGQVLCFQPSNLSTVNL